MKIINKLIYGDRDLFITELIGNFFKQPIYPTTKLQRKPFSNVNYHKLPKIKPIFLNCITSLKLGFYYQPLNYTLITYKKRQQLILSLKS